MNRLLSFKTRIGIEFAGVTILRAISTPSLFSFEISGSRMHESSLKVKLLALLFALLIYSLNNAR